MAAVPKAQCVPNGHYAERGDAAGFSAGPDNELDKMAARNRDKEILRFPERKKDCSTVLVLKSPKTASSVRNIFIPNTVAEELQKEWEHQKVLKESLGEAYEDYSRYLSEGYTELGSP